MRYRLLHSTLLYASFSLDRQLSGTKQLFHVTLTTFHLRLFSTSPLPFYMYPPLFVIIFCCSLVLSILSYLLSLLYSSVLFSSVSSSYLIFSPTFNPNFLSTCPSLSFSLLLSLSTSLPHYLTQNYPHFLFVSLVPVPRPSSK